MGAKQARPLVDVHAALGRLSRTDVAFLRALFIRLCQLSSNAPGGSASVAARPGSAVAPSAAGTSPPLTQMELLALRLPRATAVRLLLAPFFPWLRSGQLARIASTLGFQGHSNGALDWSEFVVLAYSLWYGSEELPRLGRALVDAAQSGRVNRKDWRRAAAPLFADQAAWVAAESIAATAASASQPSGSAAAASTGAEWLMFSAAAKNGPSVLQADSHGVVRGLEREWLSALFDMHWHMACYLFDRDNDGALSIAEFGRFSDDDPLLLSLLTRRIDARMARQHILAEMRISYAQIMDREAGTKTATSATQGAGAPQAAAAPAPGSSSSSSRPSVSRRPSSSLGSGSSEGLCRTFLGDGAVEESIGQIWRRQRRREAGGLPGTAAQRRPSFRAQDAQAASAAVR